MPIFRSKNARPRRDIPMKYFLAIDLGTTGCRSMLFDESLSLLSSEYKEYGLIAPRADWYEQDAELWWTLSLETMDAAMEKAGIDRGLVRAISISSQGISIVPVDRELKPLRTALSWMDGRAVDETKLVGDTLGYEEAYTLTGKRVLSAYSLPKIIWIKNHEPEIWSRTHKLLMPLDFLTARLTGEVVTDPSMASGTLLYDIHNGVWHDGVLETFGIPKSMLAEIRPAGSLAGYVLPEVAKKLGLSESCAVSIGAQDQRCAALGAGLDTDSITVSLGTAAAICKMWNTCDNENNRAVGWSPYVYPNTFVTEGVCNTAGAALRWLRDMMYPSESYKIIDREAEAARDRGTDVIFHPYMSPCPYPRYSADATGCFHGLSMATTRGDFANAVMEGVAFQVTEILEIMDRSNSASKLVLFGGGAVSKLWQQIFADATGKEILVPAIAEAAGVGAAILAGVGTGDFDLDNLPKMPLTSSTKPGEHHAETRQRYAKFLALEDSLAKGAK